MSRRAVSLVLGKCVPSNKARASKLCITRMELDPNLLMYFRKVEMVYADDPLNKCQVGDVVLLEELPSKVSPLMRHRVREVVYPLGDVADPLSGAPVAAAQYRHTLERLVKEAYGGSRPSAFRYRSAPPRGWQASRRDFSDKDTYYKYQDTPGKPQPYSL